MDYIKKIPNAVKRAPEISSYLIRHGSLEDGSPTFIALDLVCPALLIEGVAGESTSAFSKRAAFRNVSEYLEWRIRIAYPHPFSRILYLPRALEMLYPFATLNEAFAQLNTAFRIVGVCLRPDPQNLREEDARAWFFARARLGHLGFNLTQEIVCPSCGERGGGGKLALWQGVPENQEMFICDEDDEEFQADINPWTYSRIAMRALESRWDRLAIHKPYSVVGTDFERAERILLKALEDRIELLPATHHPSGTILTLQTAEPLGRWQDTVWRFYLNSTQTALGVTPIGNTVPDWYDFGSRTIFQTP